MVVPIEQRKIRQPGSYKSQSVVVSDRAPSIAPCLLLSHNHSPPLSFLMSVNAPSDLVLDTTAPTNGNPVHTHGPFPIMAFGANNGTQISSQTNDGMQFSGGENFGNSFANPPSMFSASMIPHSTPASSSGTWLANLKLAILSHKHYDGTPCFNVLEHAALADSEEDTSFIQAHSKLIQHICAPKRARCQTLETEKATLAAQNRTLSAENRSLQHQIDELRSR